jgi:CRP-like cAMP-binding protein
LGRQAVGPLAEGDRRAIRAAGLVADLPEAEAALILALARPAVFAKGQTLFLQGDPARAFFVILDGWVTLSRDTHDGERTLIKLLGPGDSFAEALVGSDARYPVTGEAAAPLRVARFEMDRFRTLLLHSPGLGLSIVAATFRQMQRLVDQIEHLKSWSVERRVADMLLRIHDGMGAPGGDFPLPVEQTLIAAGLAITPSTLSRTLRKLEPFGVSARRGRVTLHDRDRLAAHVAAPNAPCARKDPGLVGSQVAGFRTLLKRD